MNYIVIALIWAVYCVLHSYLISIQFTQRMKLVLKDYYAFYRLFYVFVSTLLLIPVFIYTHPLASEVIITYHPPWSVIRFALMMSSLLVFVRAFLIDYDLLFFFGFRQILMFGKKSVEPHGTIKRKGLLGVVRHPMYLALIIYLWCQTFRLSDIVVNAVLTVYVVIGTILEEKKLVLEFGNDYLQYQHEVPMLIPFVRPGIPRKLNL